MSRAPTRSVRQRFAGVAVLSVLLAGLLGGCGATAEDPSQEPTISGPSPTPSASPTEVTSYDIGGYTLWMRCQGEGSPTVVFDAGLGSTSTAWASVEPGVAERTRACVYDRAGLGMSQARPEGTPDPTAGSMADELRELLRVAGEDGPFVVVGHSYGGMVTQMFADRFADDVAGVVLVDSSSGPQLENSLWIKWFGEGITQWNDGAASLDLHATKKQLMDVKPLGSVPLVVLTQNYVEEGDAAFQKSWNGMQKRLAAWSGESVHVVAVKSGHGIPGDAPDLIVAAVDEVVGAARKGDSLEQCSERFRPLDGRCATP